MSSRTEGAYSFDGVPLNPVASGTSLLVSGPSLGGVRELLLRLVTGDPTEGLLLISADTDAGTALADLAAFTDRSSPGRVRAVDCSGRAGDSPDHVDEVTDPADLTGIGMSFSSLYEGLYADGYRQVRTGIYTVAPLLLYADDVRSVFRFLHTVTGRVRSADGLCVCAIDPAGHDDRTVSSVAQAFDGRIELRADEDDEEPAVRIEGLDGQPRGWQPFGPLA